MAPTGLAFGPDGSLYVVRGGSDSILRFDGNTGASLGTFVPTGSAGLRMPSALAFAPDGSLLVASAGSGDVLPYDGTTGSFLGAPLVTSGSGGLDTPTGLLIIASAEVPEPSALSLALTAVKLIAIAFLKEQHALQSHTGARVRSAILARTCT